MWFPICRNGWKRRRTVLLNVLMGLRRSEINGVKYSDVDYVNRTLSVQRQLGKKLNGKKEDFVPKTFTKQETVCQRLPISWMMCCQSRKQTINLRKNFWILWQIKVNIWLKHLKKWYIVSFAEKDYEKEQMFAKEWTTMFMCAILKNSFVPFCPCCDTWGCGVRKTQKGYAHSSRRCFG